MTGVTLAARTLDAAALAPFAVVVEPPAAIGDRTHYGDWLAPVEGLTLHFHVNRVVARKGPIPLSRIERHPHAAQAFVPLNVTRYLVTVVPDDADGAPDPDRALCMIVPGTLGVIYRPGVWHAGMTALDREGQFAVLMQRGAPDDDVFADIPPLTLTI